MNRPDFTLPGLSPAVKARGKVPSKYTGRALLTSALAIGLLAPMGAANAYSTFLTISTNQSWTQGQNFAEVSIDAIDVGGGDFDYKFTVDLCGDPTSDACGQQIEQFGFNFSGVSLSASNFDFSSNTAGPGSGSWTTNFSANMNGFGNFDVAVEMPTGGGGGPPQGVDPLMFVITGVTGDSIATYATVGSTGGQPNAGSLFSAKVSSTGPGAFVGGGTPVPVPAAIWLFGAGLLGMVGVARRSRG